MMVHPADLGRQELTEEAEPSATPSLRQQLFPTESLEKGVILRAGRGLGSCPPASIGTAMAAFFAEFALADPPLGI